MADYGQGQGLSTLADSVMGAYGAMHGMDMQDAALAVKKRQLEYEAQKLNAELAEKERLRQQQLSERNQMGPLSQAAAGAGPAEMPGIIQRHIAGSTDPFAAAQAAKVYGEGVGGFLPATERFKSSQANEFSAVVSAHAADPTGVPADAVARAAVRLQISPEVLPNLIPEITTKSQIIKSAYEALNKVPAEQGGRMLRPGEMALPGVLPQRMTAPAPTGAIAPTGVGGAGAIAPRTSDMLYGEGQNAGQMATQQIQEEAQARATGTETGNILTLGRRTSSGQTLGEMKAGQVGIEQRAKEETPQGAAKFKIDQQIREADLKLKNMQVEIDPLKRGELAGRLVQSMAMSKYLIEALPKEDPTRMKFEQIYAGALQLAQSGVNRQVIPGRPGMSGTIPKVPSKVIKVTPLQ